MSHPPAGGGQGREGGEPCGTGDGREGGAVQKHSCRLVTNRTSAAACGERGKNVTSPPQSRKPFKPCPSLEKTVGRSLPNSQPVTLCTLQLCLGEANLRPSKKKIFYILCSSLAMCHVILGSSSPGAHRGYTTLVLPACPSLLFHIFSSFPSSKHSIFHPGCWGQDHQLPHPYSLGRISRLPVRPCLTHQLLCQGKGGLPWWLRQ